MSRMGAAMPIWVAEGVQAMMSEPKHHQQHGRGERDAAAVAVRDGAEQEAAERAREKAERKDDGSKDLLTGRRLVSKEGRSKVKLESGEDVDVVPLDQVAGRSDQDRLDTAHRVLGVIPIPDGAEVFIGTTFHIVSLAPDIVREILGSHAFKPRAARA